MNIRCQGVKKYNHTASKVEEYRVSRYIAEKKLYFPIYSLKLNTLLMANPHTQIVGI